MAKNLGGEADRLVCNPAPALSSCVTLARASSLPLYTSTLTYKMKIRDISGFLVCTMRMTWESIYKVLCTYAGQVASPWRSVGFITIVVNSLKGRHA